MDATLINAFVSSIVSTFASMLQCELTRQQIVLNDRFEPMYEVTGIIGLSGEATGTVVLSLDQEVAIGATEAMLGERPNSVDSDVIDAAGELTNIIAGGAKAKLVDRRLYLALPTVIVGTGHKVSFDSGVRPICIPFRCEWGELSLEVGFCSSAAAVTV